MSENLPRFRVITGAGRCRCLLIEEKQRMVAATPARLFAVV
ncbi:MAG: hypothetical protein ACFBRM_10860 [Pikeienuella sp.]